MRLISRVAVAALLLPTWALAQEPAPRVIVVPYPGEQRPDAGQPAVAPEPPPPPNSGFVAPPPANTDVPQQPPPPQQPIVAQPPIDEPPPPPENLVPQNPPSQPPGAMLDGHPREGAFLSGPGSMTFILHHTLLGLVAGFSTQFFPRVLSKDPLVSHCDGGVPQSVCAQDARLAYLAAGLIGAGVGFGSSAAWQFFHWMSEPSAYFGLMNSLFGAMFGGGFVNLFTQDSGAVSWGAWIGALAGAWITTIVGGGELPMNKGVLMASGAYWAEIFTALIAAIFATASSGSNIQTGIDALMVAPAVGSGLMALAMLKFNPSTAQILRADLFGTAAGAIVLLVSALVLGGNTLHSAVPWALGGVAAAGGITVVSLLWADAAVSPPPISPTEGQPPPGGAPPPPGAPPPKPAYRGVW
jgi:hypothetical protein